MTGMVNPIIINNLETLKIYGVSNLIGCYSSDEHSLKRASELLMDVAMKGEDSEYAVPCLLVAAKDDLHPYPTSLKDSEMVRYLCHQINISTS